MAERGRATIEATVNLDFLSLGDRADVGKADLKEQPVAGLLERGYLKVVEVGEDEEVPELDLAKEVETIEAVETTTRKTTRAKSGE